MLINGTRSKPGNRNRKCKIFSQRCPTKNSSNPSFDLANGRILESEIVQQIFLEAKSEPEISSGKAPNWLGVRTQPKFTQNWSRGASVLRGESRALPEIHFQKAFTKLHIIFEASKLCEFIYQFLYFQISKSDIGFYIYNFDSRSYIFQNHKYGIKFTDIVNIRGFSAFLLVFIGLYNSKWPLCGNCMYICILAGI